MGILAKLKSLLGVGSGRRMERETRIDVDQELSSETERAVKESPIEEPEPESEPTSPPAEEPSGEMEDSSEIEVAEPAGSSDPVETLNGIGDAYAARLADAGIDTVADLAAADAAELAEATDIAKGRLENWIEQATER
jgi:predicted flap endonuclease-1-like 5' DNA nuclease